MKKVNLFLFVLMVGTAFTAFSQAPADFFAGKWEITVLSSPQGDITFLTELVRKDGKLTGELVNQADPASGTRKITKVEESGDKLTIYFESSQGGDMALELAKVNDDTLKGSVYGFDATAKRVK
ncbi:hypothetical protein [Telluribacter sp.]|jgi:hypothetical protein|uniref:hypothetical protein n=1 Tax=Telluribacter sp. TaxID=1978767 RepID=UPI002E0E0C4F|nr:hypothetical protein [Telluribacter sp.]